MPSNAIRIAARAKRVARVLRLPVERGPTASSSSQFLGGREAAELLQPILYPLDAVVAIRMLIGKPQQRRLLHPRKFLALENA
jgi:hypothetical protein